MSSTTVIEHDRREGTHSHPGYQTQSAHTATDRRGCRSVSSSSLLHESATPTSPKNDHQGKPRPNGLIKLTSAYAKQMTLRTRPVAPILKMSSEEDICKTRAEENHHNRTARHRASWPQVRNRSSDFTAGVDQRESSSDTPEQSRFYTKL
jgi:hypothetical protein